MKKKLITLTALACISAIAITACNTKSKKAVSATKVTNETASETTSENTTNENTEKTTEEITTSENISETTSESTSETETSTTAPLQSALPEESHSMIEAGHALAICLADKSETYNSNDPACFWDAVSYLVADYGMQSAAATIDETGNIGMSSSVINEFAAALFSSYDGNNGVLPDIPNTVTEVTYDDSLDSYSIMAGDFDSTKSSVAGCVDNGDGSYTITLSIELNDDSATEISKWNMTIVPTTYTGSGHPLFNYSITDFVQVS